ncbi:MAG: cbb3-type cytochrome c oxidase subunit 3 [Euryhalocaulis sp.]|uniref:cbb3-type cytochrome c oxidase subunit 3 n=1 Tax=Euryhalocaulis sp. TaxID=2744307 RepID=UPI00183D78C5|nr:cbb3-type cytochrome c oxidase subunit 3 [Euryhalocaulis sp.]MBA4800827.1 cbb3-type cytochrome c oxidase subunit 3 [Euryhalocaulis sp.]
MNYDTLSSFAQTWGLLLFVVIFAVVLAYALWPRNQKKFDKAARMPLDDKKPGSEDENGPGEDRKNG